MDELIKLAEKNGITHLVVDLENNRNKLLIEIYENENEFVFLDKIFDSNEDGFEHEMKVFKINYERFNENRLE